ncbi:MAG: T9SS type A sorting domain-containing protein [Bacteroidetes bacterium]|nr:T9SS type A sorting domain-containing protein [Bacteroidota bacterium]MBK9672355.1 T9SS type A sorting domain-containing protein [Bacteroidota bacterium]MBP6414376.1 T9SS type A sorting domain-containing protein [Bacteroidia bacterium]
MRISILFVTLLLSAASLTVNAQSAGPNSPIAGSTSGSGANFPNLQGFNVAGDNSVAYTDLTDYPLCPNANFCFYSKEANINGFNFSIPSNAIVNGIELRLRKMISNPLPNIKDSVVMLTKAGLPVGLNLANNLQWPNTLTYVNYGDSTNLWGTTWTAQDINNSMFGFMVRVKNTDFAQLAQYDHATIKVYYVLPNSLEETAGLTDFSVVVNDTKLSIQNATSLRGANISLFSILGKQVYSTTSYNAEPIDISSLQKGIYILQINTSKGTQSKRVVVN